MQSARGTALAARQAPAVDGAARERERQRRAAADAPRPMGGLARGPRGESPAPRPLTSGPPPHPPRPVPRLQPRLHPAALRRAARAAVPVHCPGPPARASAARCCLLPAGRLGCLRAPVAALPNRMPISQGKAQSCLRVAAGFIQCTQRAAGGLRGHVPTRPECTTPPLRCRGVAPRVRVGLPSDAIAR